jgi:hypothetical protein
VTYEEMKTAAETFAKRVDGELLPFDPGDLPEIVVQLDGEDFCLTVSPV